MFRKIISLVTILQIFLLSGCMEAKNQTDVEDQKVLSENSNTIHFKQYLKEIGEEDSLFGTYLVIHTNICSTCIERLKKYIKSDPMITTRFILSGRSSKHIRLTFSDEIINRKNIVLDNRGIWDNHKINNQEVKTAELFYAEKNEIVKRISISPSDLDNILDDLTSWENAYINSWLFFAQHPQFSNLLNSRAPDIKRKTTQGELFNLHDRESKIVVLNFWSDRCAFCIIEMPVLNRIFKEYKDKGVEVVSIYRSSPESLEKYFEDERYNDESKNFIEFPIIASAEDIINSYSVKGFPMTYVIDQQGRISYISYFVNDLEPTNDRPLYYSILKGQIDRTFLKYGS